MTKNLNNPTMTTTKRDFNAEWGAMTLNELTAEAQKHDLSPGDLIEILSRYIAQLAAMAFAEYMHPRVMDEAKAAMDLEYETVKAEIVALKAQQGATVQ